MRESSARRLVVEMYIVRIMGLDRLNIHPGTGDVTKFDLVADAINTSHELVPGVVVVLETMAGNSKGTCYGCSFVELK